MTVFLTFQYICFRYTSQQYGAIFLIIIVVMGNCCYYKYGYCYYCSPGKVMMIFSCLLYIVIWSPAGQRRNVTMVEIFPSLHSACDELKSNRGGMWLQGVSFYSETPEITEMLAHNNKQCYLCTLTVLNVFFSFFTQIKIEGDLI